LQALELLTLFLDLGGLILISWYLFFIPGPVSFEVTYNTLKNLQPVKDAINAISRNINLIKKMRIGFSVLVFSLLIKILIAIYKMKYN
jgi:hypothetical protein